VKGGQDKREGCGEIVVLVQKCRVVYICRAGQKCGVRQSVMRSKNVGWGTSVGTSVGRSVGQAKRVE